MNLDRLRAQTRAEHEATESAMPLMHEGLTRDQYADVLQRLYRVVAGWEFWVQALAPQDLADTVQTRRRAGLLEQDLRFLGCPAVGESAQIVIPGLHPEQPQFRTRFLGAMYVMEGSTLGGQYIARHLEEKLALTPGEGDAYFRGYGERTGEMWRAFKAILAQIPEEDSDDAIAAAKAMFEVFRLSMAQGVS